MADVTATWNTTAGDWFAAGNWDEPNPVPPPPTIHYVPTADNDVTFNGTGPYTVTYNGTDTVHSIGGSQLVTIAIDGGSLTVDASAVGGSELGVLSTAANSTFALADTAGFEIDGVAANAGTITLNGLTGPTQLTFGQQTVASPVTLTGGGAITLSDNANNDIFINNSATLDNFDNTISGGGAITSNFQSLTNEAKGVIDATGILSGLTVTLPTFTNAGLLEATGTGGLQLDGTTHAADMTIENAGGTIAAIGAGTHVDLSGGTTIAGGTLTTSGGGVIQVTAGTCTLDGTGTNAPVTITAGSNVQLDDNTTLNLTGGAPTGVIVNQGTIALNSTGDTTTLHIGQQTTTSPVSLQGGGAVTLSDNANNRIYIDNSASLDNVDNTISGAGSITSNFTSLTNEAQGIIDATGTNGLLLGVPTVTNKGLLEDTGTGGLQISAPNGTTVVNVGGTISATGAGTHVDLNGATIQGGSLGGTFQLTGGNTFDGTGGNAPLTIAAGSTVQLADNAGLTLSGGTATNPGVIINQGTIALNSTGDNTTLVVTGTVSLQGGGKITLSDAANNGIFNILDNVDNTISGAGSFGGLINESAGIVDATGTMNGLRASFSTITNKGLLEDTGTAGLQLSSDTVVNGGGTISANGDGTHVDLNGTTIQGGTLTTATGGVLNVMDTVDLDGSTAGAVTVTGAVTGTGTLTLTAGETTFAAGATLATSNLSIAGGATATIAESLAYTGAVASNGTVTLEGANTLELGGAVSGGGAVGFALGATATLQIDEAALPDGQTFANTVAAFDPGDVIDLRGLAFQGNATPVYDGTTGALTVMEGAVTDTLNLTAPGATTFAAEADGFGGTEIVVCFCSGTLIRTRQGDVAVETLRVGEHLVTASGAHRPIHWVGHRRIDCRRHPRPQEAWPVRIAAHAFGDGKPARDLFVSPGHSICVDLLGEVLIPALALANGTTVQQVDVETVTYWHVELDSHDVILAENLPCESYLDMGNRDFFMEAAVVGLTAGPDGRPSLRTHADFCRPFCAEGPLVEAVRARLVARVPKRQQKPAPASRCL